MTLKVEGMASRTTQDGGTSDLDVIHQVATDKLGSRYVIMLFRRMSPQQFGYPVNRPRRSSMSVRRAAP